MMTKVQLVSYGATDVSDKQKDVGRMRIPKEHEQTCLRELII